jgi:hypothetical protein
MPRKRKTAKPASSAKNCAGRINYAKIKVGAGNEFSELASEAIEASDQHLTFRANDQEQQGHGLTGVLAPLVVPAASFAAKCGGEDYMVNDDKFFNAPDLGCALGIALRSDPEPNVEFDLSGYLGYLDHLAISEDQKMDMLMAMFRILQDAIEVGIGVHPVQLACGKLAENADESDDQRPNVVVSKATTLSQEFNRVAAQ